MRADPRRFRARRVIHLFPESHYLRATRSDGAVIEVSYSERGGLPEGTPELAAEGEAFLKGRKQRREPAK